MNRLFVDTLQAVNTEISIVGAVSCRRTSVHNIVHNVAIHAKINKDETRGLPSRRNATY